MATNKPIEFTMSAANLSRLEIGVNSRALKVVNTSETGKITVKLEKQFVQNPAVRGLITFFLVLKKIHTPIISCKSWIM